MRRAALRLVLLGLLTAANQLSAASFAWADDDPGACDAGCTGFERVEYLVSEAADYVELSVFAPFAPPGQGQIDYYTADLSAVAGQDYQQTSGTATFLTNGRQDIRVPITQDGLVEGQERFEVRLTNFRGTFVQRGHETAVVTIRDDDVDDDDEDLSPENTASSGRPSGQTAGSPPGSSAPPPSAPPTVPASFGSTEPGNQSVPVLPDDPPNSGEHVPANGARPVSGEEVREYSRPPRLLLVGSGALLLALIAAGGSGLKKKVRR